jgi:hypothetical protein
MLFYIRFTVLQTPLNLWQRLAVSADAKHMQKPEDRSSGFQLIGDVI